MLKHGLAVAVLGVLGACAPILDGPDTNPGGGTPKDSAEIIVSNQITRDPQSLFLLLYLTTATDPDASPVQYRSPIAVPSGEERVFKVPAGIWKVARQELTGDRFAMMADLGSEIWPSAKVDKDGNYLILIRTDDGNNNVWVTNLQMIR